MDTVKELLDLLLKGGPWTVIAVLAWVIKKLYDEKREDAALHAKEKQELNDRLINTVKEQTVVLTSATENSKALIAAVGRLEG